MEGAISPLTAATRASYTWRTPSGRQTPRRSQLGEKRQRSSLPPGEGAPSGTAEAMARNSGETNNEALVFQEVLDDLQTKPSRSLCRAPILEVSVPVNVTDVVHGDVGVAGDHVPARPLRRGRGSPAYLHVLVFPCEPAFLYFLSSVGRLRALLSSPVQDGLKGRLGDKQRCHSSFGRSSTLPGWQR